MNIKETIMHYISVYCGSEKRVVEHTIEDHIREFHKKSEAENAVKKCISWLLEKNYVSLIYNRSDMTDCEKRYFDSDKCLIYRVIKKFDEIEYYESQRLEREREEKLGIRDRLILYIEKMEKKSKFENPFAEFNYETKKDNKSLTFMPKDNQKPINIIFSEVSDLYYDENGNSISYSYQNCKYMVDLDYMCGKINIRKYKI